MDSRKINCADCGRLIVDKFAKLFWEGKYVKICGQCSKKYKSL